MTVGEPVIVGKWVSRQTSAMNLNVQADGTIVHNPMGTLEFAKDGTWTAWVSPIRRCAVGKYHFTDPKHVQIDISSPGRGSLIWEVAITNVVLTITRPGGGRDEWKRARQ